MNLNKRQLDLIEKAWQKAHDYEYQYISGSAIGLVTIGIIQQKVKCTAVAMWQKQIWAEYYRVKELIKVGKFAEPDYAQFGPIPHPVPELTVEIFGV